MTEKIKTILAGVNDNKADFFELMEELKNLAYACNYEVVGELTQNMKSINAAYYMGTGKLEELKILLNQAEAEVLIFNNELSPSQLRNLENYFSCEIIDRTSLILEIFKKRAKTREAKLQVEIAQMQYLLPRIKEMSAALNRQGGSTGGSGTRNRGEGETKLELNRRKISMRIAKLNRELDQINSERHTQRKLRRKSDLPMIALVGYTNAGKSTLMNAMVELYGESDDKKVFVKDMLFATLETSVRHIVLPDNKAFLLSDTVGFVSELPVNLVKAFRSTLEEVCDADLLLHVIDCSSDNHMHHVEVTLDTLKQIEATQIPIINVYNKADLVNKASGIHNADEVYISAKEKVGISELLILIKEKLFINYVTCNMLIPYDQGNVIAYLNDNAYVQEISYEDQGTLLTVECKERDYQRFYQYVYRS